jgi:hypothetical protein
VTNIFQDPVLSVAYSEGLSLNLLRAKPNLAKQLTVDSKDSKEAGTDAKDSKQSVPMETQLSVFWPEGYVPNPLRFQSRKRSFYAPTVFPRATELNTSDWAYPGNNTDAVCVEPDRPILLHGWTMAPQSVQPSNGTWSIYMHVIEGGDTSGSILHTTHLPEYVMENTGIDLERQNWLELLEPVELEAKTKYTLALEWKRSQNGGKTRYMKSSSTRENVLYSFDDDEKCRIQYSNATFHGPGALGKDNSTNRSQGQILSLKVSRRQ